ncbi:MAG: EAL domain-containing protein, partial [Pseudomonadota bacterium]
KQLLKTIWPFCFIVALLLFLGIISMQVLSSVRAYVSGESFWSKAQKESTYHLNRYAVTHSEFDYQQFLREIEIPLQDKVARLALQKTNPDTQAAAVALIKAKNNPDDVTGLVQLFLYFQHTSLMAPSIEYWVEGDELIAQIVKLADELHQHIAAGNISEDKVSGLVEQINQINSELTPLEDAFSNALGDASRNAQILIVSFMIGITFVLMLIGVYLTRRLVLRDAALLRTIQISEERWKFALDGARDGVWDWNLLTNELTLSSQWKEMLGYDDDMVATAEERGKLLHPDDLPKVLDALNACVLGKADRYAIEHRILCKDGSYKWVLGRGKVVSFSESGKAERVVGTHTDIHEMKNIEAALRESDSNQRALLEAMIDGVFVAQDYRFIFSNPVLPKMLGYSHEEFVGLHFEQVIAPECLEVWNQRFTNRVEDDIGYAQSDQVRFLTKDSQESIWMDLHDSRVYFHGERSVLGILRDVSKQKEAEDLIWQQANFDGLTGLPNRRMFRDRLEQELRKTERTGSALAVMYLDLDHFKEVNDTMGHDKGDTLLKDATLRLKSCVRDTDTVARLGGDEFVILLSEIDGLSGLERIAQNILNQLEQPFTLDLEPVYISASIGITICPIDAADFDSLLKNADQAMYAAKAEGRNRYSYFTPSMQAAAQSRMRLANDLRHAANRDELKLVYQPIIKISSGEVYKAEALIRWHHPTLGLISPAQFIPVAEDTGIIYEIGEWVFNEAIQQVKQWRESLHSDFQISINKSPVQFKTPNSTWVESMEKMGLPGSSLVVEITEGSLLDATDNVASNLLKFRDAGIQVAIDDFGTGYSSLSYLKKYDIDYIKIDQSFVKNMTANSSDLGLCEAIILMAHKLGMQVIAEGVETQGQYDLLAAAGCDYAQGYLFSKPVDTKAFEDYWHAKMH